MGLGPWEITLIILAIILLFGGKKLPELARGLGLGLREFKKATKEIKDEVKSAADTVEDIEKDIKEYLSIIPKIYIKFKCRHVEGFLGLCS